VKNVREVRSNGDVLWRQNGTYHREDGPAITWSDGSQFWFRHGLAHREDGPMAEYSQAYADKHYDGQRYQWWYNGVKLPCQTSEEFERWKKLKLFW